MEESPPAPPMRYTSNSGGTLKADSSGPGYKPLPNTPTDDEKKKRKLKMPWQGSKSEDKPSKQRPEISYPTSFEHTVHVGFDSITGEFTGMPEHWAKLLMSSQITKTEQKKNPQAVLDALKFYDDSNTNRNEKFMTQQKVILSKGSSLEETFEQTSINSKHPNTPKSPYTEEDDEDDDAPPAIAPRPEHTKSKVSQSNILPELLPQDPDIQNLK